MACPDETALSDFLQGPLPAARRVGVLKHVEGCESCQRALAGAAESSPTVRLPDGTRPTGSAPPLARGAMLSRYVVLEQIGVGAMGVVYAAYDPELDRQVALKLLRHEGRHLEELRLRLLREAQALARLSHPNVVAVHDVGTCGDDSVFLALELVDGTTLVDWLKQPRTWREVLSVFVDAGRGLAAAHAAGLVHRDFKPANVLVGRDGRVRVTDFGLARPSNRDAPTPEAPPQQPVAADSSLLSPLTQTGALVGTPAYMAPEQIGGGAVDARSDQYGFCVALHEALFGARPSEGPIPRDTKVSARVRAAVLRGLRERPEERFATMDALLAVLDARPRVRTWVAASAAVASVLGVGVGYGGALQREPGCEQDVEKISAAWGPARRERVKAAFLATGQLYAAPAWDKLSADLDAHAAQWRTLRTEVCEAPDAYTSETAWQAAACLDARLWQLAAVTELLEHADAQTVQNAPQLLASLEGLTGCRDAPAHSTRPQPPDALRPRVDAARRRLAEARARMEAGRHAEGVEVTSALLKDLKGLDYRPLEAEMRVLHGQLLGLAGRMKDAEEHLYKALWAAEAGRDDEMVARVWTLLIWVVGEQVSRVGEAERLIQHARASVERLGRERYPFISTELHLRLGGLLLVQGQLELADAEFTRGIELARRAFGPDSLRTSYFLSSLGRVRSRQLRTAEALELFQQAQAQRERLWGPDHPSLALNLSNMATELLSLGRPEEAIAAWRRSLALLEAARSPDHPSLAAPLNNLGSALRLQGRLDEARTYQQRALAIFERSKGPDHPSTATALNALGMVAYDSQHHDEALALHQQAVERLERTLGPDSPRLAPPRMFLGLVLHRLGRQAEARHHLSRALELWKKNQGPDGAMATNALRPLARVDLATGASRAALGHCEHALRLDEKTQGAEAPDVALDLACLAEAHLALAAPDQAVPLLERAGRIHARSPRDPLDAAWATFLLARALGEQGQGPHRSRAAVLAEESRSRLEALGLRARWELREVMAWQARHPAPASLVRNGGTP